jgi:hypothetical protein
MFSNKVGSCNFVISVIHIPKRIVVLVRSMTYSKLSVVSQVVSDLLG